VSGLDFSWLSDPLYVNWLIQGVLTTLGLSAVSLVLAFLCGIAGYACIHFRVPILAAFVRVLVELLRNTPPLVQMFFLYFTLTRLGLTLTDPATGQSVPLFSGFVCVVLSLAFYNGALAVEIVRSGVEATPVQTVEGARSLGYSPWQIFLQVELPIGLRLSMPAMTNNMVSLVKTSAQASLVAVGDIMYYANQIMLETFRTKEIILIVWILYITIVSALVVVVRLIEHRVALHGYGHA
jgi:polar amino acid transport system permease protein